MNLLAKFSGPLTSLRGHVQSLEVRLRRTTNRERFLIGALVLAGLLYAPIAFIGWRDEANEAYINALAERSAARLARQAAVRANANGANEAAVEDMKTWGFEAGNVAIAQVQLEQRLLSTATLAGLTTVKITTDAKIETIGPTTWTGAEVQADLKWANTFAFLDALTRWPEGFRIKRFKYDVSTLPVFALANPGVAPPSGRIVLGIAAPVSVPQDAAVAAVVATR